MTVSVNQAIEICTQLVEMNQTVLLVGAPGCGKTDAMNQVATLTDRHIFIEHPAVSAPEDYKGFAMFKDGEADFFPLGQMKDILAYPKPFILGMDDLGQAAGATQNGLMQIIHPRGRRLGKHVIPDHCAVIAATNRKQDNAGVMGLTEPLKDRFNTILHIDVSLPEWMDWAIAHNIDPLIITFLHYRPGLLSAFKPARDMTRTPTPRGWEFVNNLLDLQYSSTMLFTEAISGCIGESAASEFVGFREILMELPDLDDIESGFIKDGSNMNNNACYAVVGALSVRGQNNLALENVTQFVESLPTEFKVLWSEIWYKTNRDKLDTEHQLPLKDAPAWGKWIQKYANILDM